LAYLSTNCVTLDKLDDQEIEFIESEIISRISTSDNAHLIKIVHSVLSEYKYNGNKLYHFAALKMVKDGFR
jgi:hypothetical protein